MTTFEATSSTASADIHRDAALKGISLGPTTKGDTVASSNTGLQAEHVVAHLGGSNNFTVNYGNGSPENTLQNILKPPQASPEDDKIRIEHERGHHNQAFCEWVFYHASFKKWREEQNSRVLWIKGDTGKGKTMLLAGIINEILREKKESEGSKEQAINVTYFFCQRQHDTINKATAVLRGLIFLLVDKNKTLIKHWHDPPESVNTIFSLSRILETMLGDIKGEVYLIVDALDECQETEGLKPLLSLLLLMVSRLKDVRLLVSSCDKNLIRNLGIENCLPPLEIELDTRTISPAVSMYIESKLSKIEWLKDNTALRSQVRAKIQEKAHSTFLWVYFFSLCLEELEELEAKKSSAVLKMLDDAPLELPHIKHFTLLREGYQQYVLFKRGRCRDYSLLDKAIVKYTDIIVAASSSSPKDNIGIIKAKIHLTECYRELSHDPNLKFSDKMAQVKEAEECITNAENLLRRVPNDALLQRVRLEKAVLDARKILVGMKQPGRPGKALRDERSRTKQELGTLRKDYERVGNKASASWAEYWLDLLDKAK